MLFYRQERLNQQMRREVGWALITATAAHHTECYGAGLQLFQPCVLDITLQSGGKMLDTCTRLHFSIPASRSDNSKECRSSLWEPTPLVRTFFEGGFDSIYFSIKYF